MMETRTDGELIDELARRHKDLIVIRPMASNIADKKDKLRVFCKTSSSEGTYDLFEAVELLHDAHVGLMRDCLTKEQS